MCGSVRVLTRLEFHPTSVTHYLSDDEQSVPTGSVLFEVGSEDLTLSSSLKIWWEKECFLKTLKKENLKTSFICLKQKNVRNTGMDLLKFQ